MNNGNCGMVRSHDQLSYFSPQYQTAIVYSSSTSTKVEAEETGKSIDKVADKKSSKAKGKFINSEDLPELMTVNHLCAFLSVSRNKGYDIMNEADFPSFKLGEKLLRVHRDDFLKWVSEKRAGKMLESQLKQ